jgi:hypothetical protein
MAGARPGRRGDDDSRLSSRQQRVPGGRKNTAKVLMSDDEYELIATRAAKIGVSIPRLLVETAIAAQDLTLTERRALLSELLMLRRMLATITEELQQLTARTNSAGQPPATDSATRRIALVATRLDRAVKELLPGTEQR